MELKRTPLFDLYSENGGHVVPFAGWEMPVRFNASISEEHLAVREKAGIFDVSHMGEILLQGKDALSFANYLITNDVRKLQDGQVCYSVMCNDRGGAVDDLLAYKFGESKVMLVVNASNIDKDHEWILSKRGNFNVDIKNISEEMAQIAVQGPKAQEILQKTTTFELDKIGFFFFKEIVLGEGINAIVSRTGYTGEDGFEVYLSSVNAIALWNMIMKAGKNLGLQPIGLGARDTLRFEAKLMLYGNELDDETSPLSAGLSWAVSFEKDFVGKDALLKQQADGLKKYLVGFEMSERAIPRHGYAIYCGGEKVGAVTSGTFAPFLQKNLGLGYVPYEIRKSGTEIEIEVRGEMKKALIVKTPFYKKQYKKTKENI